MTAITRDNDAFLTAYAEHEQRVSDRWSSVGSSAKGLAKYVGDNLPGACKYGVSTVKDIAGGLVRAVVEEGKNLAKSVKAGVVGYVDASVKAEEYRALEERMNAERGALGINEVGVENAPGLRTLLGQAKRYEELKVAAEKAKMDIDKYAIARVRGERASKLEKEMADGLAGNMSDEDLARLVAQYKVFMSEGSSVVNDVMERVEKHNAKQKKEEALGKAKEYIERAKKSNNVAEASLYLGEAMKIYEAVKADTSDIIDAKREMIAIQEAQAKDESVAKTRKAFSQLQYADMLEAEADKLSPKDNRVRMLRNDVNQIRRNNIDYLGDYIIWERTPEETQSIEAEREKDNDTEVFYGVAKPVDSGESEKKYLIGLDFNNKDGYNEPRVVDEVEKLLRESENVEVDDLDRLLDSLGDHFNDRKVE